MRVICSRNHLMLNMAGHSRIWRYEHGRLAAADHFRPFHSCRVFFPCAFCQRHSAHGDLHADCSCLHRYAGPQPGLDRPAGSYYLNPRLYISLSLDVSCVAGVSLMRHVLVFADLAVPERYRQCLNVSFMHKDREIPFPPCR